MLQLDAAAGAQEQLWTPQKDLGCSPQNLVDHNRVQGSLAGQALEGQRSSPTAAITCLWVGATREDTAQLIRTGRTHLPSLISNRQITPPQQVSSGCCTIVAALAAPLCENR